MLTTQHFNCGLDDPEASGELADQYQKQGDRFKIRLNLNKK